MVVISSQSDINNLVTTLNESETTVVLTDNLIIEDFNANENPNFLGLINLNTIDGDFIIRSNGFSYFNFYGLNNLRTINGNFIIEYNDFTHFYLNKDITIVNGNIEITNNYQLKTISNFTSLVTLGGGFTIANNPLINFLPDIPYLTVVNGDFIISSMYGIMYIISNYCSKLYNINGKLIIAYNENLIHIDGFVYTSNNPQFYIRDQLQIVSNPYLVDILGFDGIQPNTSLLISDNTNLCKLQYVYVPSISIVEPRYVRDGAVTCRTQLELNQLENIKIITDDLTITGFTPDFSKLSNLEEIGGTLTISNNITDTVFNYFNNLKIICDDLYIINNVGLSEVSGFNNLLTIGGNMYIINNGLTKVSGFTKLKNIFNMNQGIPSINDSNISGNINQEVEIYNQIVYNINTFQMPSIFIPKKHQTISNYKTAEDVISRRVIMKSWNTANAVGVINNHARITSPFPSVYNRTDFLSRKECDCDIPNPLQESRHILKSNMGSIIKSCDGTGVPCANTNVKYVPDSSLYTRYKREVMANKNFNT